MHYSTIIVDRNPQVTHFRNPIGMKFKYGWAFQKEIKSLLC